MDGTPIEIAVGAARLRFVPSVHYRLAFAERVNGLCRGRKTRPDAIAVELGPRLTAAAARLLTSLGVGSDRRNRLPCLLGMLKRNRYLRPSVRERARRMQEETGCELHQLPPEQLFRELGFAAVRMVPLSPTDSIVEAMRCALELDVALYGVDLDEMADAPMQAAMIEDPAAARGAVEHYALANAAYADRCSEREVVPRREAAIAARLKALASRHRRVLFVCGLGHWRRLAALLADERLQPATRDIQPAASFKRKDLAGIDPTVVEPGLAWRYLDAFPAVAAAYERARAHPLLGGGGAAPDYNALLGRILRRACRHYFGKQPGLPLSAEEARTFAALDRFETVLKGSALLGLHRVPDLALIMRCARSLMAEPFCNALLTALMEFPWAQPEDFKDFVTIEAEVEAAEELPMVTLADRKRSVRERIVVSTTPEGADKSTPATISWGWQGPRRSRPWLGLGGFRFTWTPWEDVVTAMSLQAIGMVRMRQRLASTEPFCGQLLDGLEPKATLRAQARGEDHYFVRDARLRSAARSEVSTDGFPIVWIFDTGPATDDRWHTYFERLDWFLPFVRAPERLQRIGRRDGDNVAEVVGFGREDASTTSLEPRPIVECVTMRGLLLFAPLFSASRQYARWFERIDDRNMPVYGMAGASPPPALIERCERRGVRFEELSWQDGLVAIAVAYASAEVTVVAPKGHEIGHAVQRLARRQGTPLNRVPLAALAKDLTRRMTLNHMVSGRHDWKDGTPIYDPKAEELLGERRDRYRDLVPPAWRTFCPT